MVDPVSLSASTIITLAFTKFLESSAGKLAEKFTEAAIAKMDVLREKIWEKLRLKSTAKNALELLEKGSKTELNNVAAYLQVAMMEDPKFAAEVQALAQEIDTGKTVDNSRMMQQNNDNAKGWQTKVEGGTAYIGEIHIQSSLQNSQ
jgi:hypothetical protein